jgi:hypothetical protein
MARLGQIPINGEEMRSQSSSGSTGTWATCGSTAASFHILSCGLGLCRYLSDSLGVVIRSWEIDDEARAICRAPWMSPSTPATVLRRSLPASSSWLCGLTATELTYFPHLWRVVPPGASEGSIAADLDRYFRAHDVGARGKLGVRLDGRRLGRGGVPVRGGGPDGRRLLSPCDKWP